ncbi:hypothetical protein [Kitasatospora purpeofusca]|uniref:hypothetical protein n=1 Tax=Kitasatospora purpeofusca TaxID=67352 RepID=UPI002A5A3E62|nr:hypothetical protein [Kitasatospora purpeofusca]MDY0813902.1 hypothetical protein [Kitasatospora purpeofusca]
MRTRSACLAVSAALSVLALAPAASAAVPGAASAPAARLAACNEVGTRQPGDMLMQVRVVAGNRTEASYPGYTITRIEGYTLLGGPMCITVTAGGPGTDHVSVTTAAAVGTVKIFAKPVRT